MSPTPSEELLRACRAFVRAIPGNLNYITAQALARRLADDPDSVFLLDNRDRATYCRAHIPGAVNFPLRDVLAAESLARLPRDRQIVVCCWVGHTASQLVAILQLLGYDAIALKYGMGEPAVPGEARDGWMDLGLPLSTGEDP